MDMACLGIPGGAAAGTAWAARLRGTWGVVLEILERSASCSVHESAACNIALHACLLAPGTLSERWMVWAASCGWVGNGLAARSASPGGRTTPADNPTA